MSIATLSEAKLTQEKPLLLIPTLVRLVFELNVVKCALGKRRGGFEGSLNEEGYVVDRL